MRFTTPLMLVLLTIAGLVAQVPQNGLVAWYTFDGGSLSNEVGPNLELSTYNGGGISCADRDGVAGNAMSFSDAQTTGILYALDDENLPAGNNGLTICFWIRTAGSPDMDDYILSWGTPSTGVKLFFNGDTLVCSGFSQEIKTELRELGDIHDTWYHVAISLTGSSVRVYLNGSSKGTFTGASVSVTTDDQSVLTIGAGLWGTHGRLDAMVDDVCIYNRGLLSSEVNTIVNPVSIRPSAQRVRRNVSVLRSQGYRFSVPGQDTAEREGVVRRRFSWPSSPGA